MPVNAGGGVMNPVRGGRFLPLSALPNDGRGVIKEIRCGRGIASRMISMGLTIGVEVVMRRNNGCGSLIVQVRESSVALGRGEAQKILVMPLPA